MLIHTVQKTKDETRVGLGILMTFSAVGQQWQHILFFSTALATVLDSCCFSVAAMGLMCS